MSVLQAVGNMDENYKKFRRHLPHIHSRGTTYFLTFRAHPTKMDDQERDLVLKNLKQGDEKFYTLIAAIVMPDHVHAIIRPNEGVEFSRITKGIKGTTARLINKLRNRKGTFWQDESYDRIIRHDDEFMDTLNYMLLNSVRANLCEDPWKYPWWYFKGL